MPATDCEAYVRACVTAALTGAPFETLVDACREQAAIDAAAKVVDFAAMRRKLRPHVADPAALEPS